MNTSTFKKSGIGLLLLVALTLSACAKQEGSAVRVAGRGAQSGAAPIPNTPNTCGPEVQSTAGKIYGTTSQFELEVKNFVSATLDPQAIGHIGYQIDSPTGIDFFGSFQFDSQGNLVPQNSYIQILIFDSYAIEQNGQAPMVDPYVVSFSQAFAGNKTGNRINVTFKDDYGDIILSGTIDHQGIVSGEVSYSNKIAVPGYTPMSGRLGQFSAYACALIK